MGFIPPLNLGNFQPSPATLSQWIYQIWQYLQENPIATQEQLQGYISTFITTSPETQTMIGEGVEQYLTENPPQAPVQSVQGKTGAVQLAYNEIVPASNAVPIYKAASTPSTNTLTGQYNLGYRLFVNTTTQEIFTISPAGALSLVGRGKFDGTTIDVNSTEGDTTISEAIGTLNTDISSLQTRMTQAESLIIKHFSKVVTINGGSASAAVNTQIQLNFTNMSGYEVKNVCGFILYKTGAADPLPYIVGGGSSITYTTILSFNPQTKTLIINSTTGEWTNYTLGYDVIYQRV